jgi:glutaredoxin
MKKAHHVVLYSKPGCHLCEIAKEELFSLQGEYDISLQEYNINDDPLLFEKYKYTIPVMVIDDKIELEVRIDARKIRRAFGEGYGPTYRIIRS